MKQKSRCSRTGPDLLCRWWRGQDMNLRPSGYEPDKLTGAADYPYVPVTLTDELRDEPKRLIDQHLANIGGAFSLAISDQIAGSVVHSDGPSWSEIAALTSLDQFLGPSSVDSLRQLLGITHSGAVRLVDRMAAAGLVERGPGADGRTRAVVLTAEGRSAADRAASDRKTYLSSVLTGLSTSERRTLDLLLAKVMTNVVDAKNGGAWICRLCDLDACGRAQVRCPTATAAAAKYQHHPLAASGPPDEAI